MNRGVMGRQMFAKGGPAFPDLSGDGQITQKDILMGRGVVPMSEGGATLSEEDYFAKAGLSKADYEGLNSQDQMRLMQSEMLARSMPEEPITEVPLQVRSSAGGDPMMALQARAESYGMPLEEYISILRSDPSFAEQELNAGLPVMGMAAGGVTPDPAMMAPPPGDMMAPGGEMAPPPGGEFDPAVFQGMLETAQTQFQGVDAAAENEDFGAMMNAIRGDEAPIEARYEELAEMVGPEDAQQTPESVLTLLQPVMQMAAVDQGIGGLAQDEMMAPVEGPMAEGIMSTVNMAPPPGAPAPAPAGVDPMAMAAPGGAAPVNFRQGGAVQYFNPENDERVVQADPNRLNELYEQNLALRQSIMGSGDQASEYEDQKRITQSQMLFDIAQGALAFATPGETQMSAAERLAQVAQPVLGNIGARTGDLQKFKQSQTKDARALKLDALGSAETMLDKEQAEKARTALKQQEIDATTARDIFAQAKDFLILDKQQDFARKEGVTERAHGLTLADRKIAAQNALQQLQGSQQIGVETLRGQLREQLAEINNTFMENQQGREFSFKTKSTLSAQEYQKSANEKLFENQKAIQAIGNTNNVAEIKLRDKLVKENNKLAAEADVTQRAVDFENVLKLEGVKTASQIKVMGVGAEQDKALATHRGAITAEQASLNQAFTAGENVLDRIENKDARISNQEFQKLLQNDMQDFQGTQKEKDRVIAGINRAFDEKLATRGADQKDLQLTISERAQALDEFYKSGMLSVEEAALSAVKLGSESVTNQINFFADENRLQKYANNTLTPTETAQFEGALLNYNKTSSYDWNGTTFTQEAPALAPMLREAIITRQQNFPDLPKPKLGETALIRPASSTVTTVEDGAEVTDGSQLKYDSPEFKQQLWSAERGVNLNSPEWDRVPTEIVDENVRYERATGMGEVLTRVGNYFTENLREIGGFDPMSLAQKEIVQADKDIDTLRETILMEVTNWSDNRVLKTTQDALRKNLGDLTPGIWKSDEGALFTLQAVKGNLARAFGNYASKDPLYNPDALGQYTKTQITNARARATEIRGMIAEVKLMENAYSSYLDGLVAPGRSTDGDGEVGSTDETRSIIRNMIK